MSLQRRILASVLTAALILQMCPASAWALVDDEAQAAQVSAEGQSQDNAGDEEVQASKTGVDETQTTVDAEVPNDDDVAASQDADASTSDSPDEQPSNGSVTTEPTDAAAATEPADESEADASQQEEAPVEPTDGSPKKSAEGDVHVAVGERRTYADLETGYFYLFEVLTSDGTSNATVCLYDIQYIGERNYGSVVEPPAGTAAGSVDYEYPSQIYDEEIGYTFTVTALRGLPLLPSFRSLHIPATVTELVETSGINNTNSIKTVLSGQDYVTQVTFAADCPITEIPDGFFADEGGETVTHLERVVLPDSVEHIGSSAFEHCWFESFKLPTSLRSIGDRAFANCYHLATIEWNSQLETIGAYAFYSNVLTSIDFPNSLQTIGDFAFCKHKLITGYHTGTYDPHILFDTVVIPDGVTSIGAYAFAEISGRGSSYNATGDSTAITTVTLGTSLQSIGEYAFPGASMTSLVLPATLQEIGDYAFWNCRELESVTWDNVDQVHLATLTGFSGCSSLTSFEIPVSTVVIGDSAFSECASLTSVTIPPGVTSIEAHAFNSAGLEQISIPGSVKSIGDCAFCYCRSLTKANLSEGLETIGQSAFYDTPLLTAITIPSTVSLIGMSAFSTGEDYWGSSQYGQHGGGLRSLTIEPGAVALTIDDSAFAFCDGLNGSTIVIPARTSLLCGAVFIGISNATFEIQGTGLRLGKGSASTSTSTITVTGLSDEEVEALDDEDDDGSGGGGGGGGGDIIYTAPNLQRSDGEGNTADIPDPWSAQEEDLIPLLPDPNGSVVRYPSTLTLDTSASLATYIKYASQAGTRYPTFEPYDPEGGEEDPPVELNENGTLQVTCTGEGGSSARVLVFDAAGDLAANKQASAGFAVISGLAPGTYTVIGLARNPYISTVGSLYDFAGLALAEENYACVGATVSADAPTKIELSVPGQVYADASAAVESSSVAISKADVYQGTEFFATVNFQMARDSVAAEGLVLALPKGLELTSVSSANKTYDTTDWDLGTLTVPLDDADAVSGRIWVGFRAKAAGTQTLVASLATAAGTLPLGSAVVRCKSLTLEVPSEPVSGRTFAVSAYAAPGATVTFQSAGKTFTATTNRLGRANAVIDLTDVESTLDYTIVTASTNIGGEIATASDTVKFVTVHTESCSLWDFSFVHATEKHFLVREGHSTSEIYDTSVNYYDKIANSSWYTYIANGQEKNKYWTFEASYVTDECLWNDEEPPQVVEGYRCMVQVQMLDGSSRVQEMPLISSVPREEGGFLSTFACSMYIEQAGDHVFPTSLIPSGFDVTLSTPNGTVERTQADIDILRDRIFETYDHWLVRVETQTEQDLAAAIGEEAGGDEQDLADATDCNWAFFYDVREEPIWEYYEEHLTAEELAQVEAYLDECDEALAMVGSIFDAFIGAKYALIDCQDLVDWICRNLLYEDDQDFDEDDLEADGWDVTTDNNANSVSGGGTPTNGISDETTFAQPDRRATRRHGEDDGTGTPTTPVTPTDPATTPTPVAYIDYRDSNGNLVTIPASMLAQSVMEDGGIIDWGNVGDMLVLGLIPIGELPGILKEVDYQMNVTMTPEEWKTYGKSNLEQYAKAVKGTMQVGVAVINTRQRLKDSAELEGLFVGAAEARGYADNLQIQLNYKVMHGDTTSECYKALREEHDWACIVADGKSSDAHWHAAEVARGLLCDWIGYTIGTATSPAGSTAIYLMDKTSAAVIADGMESNQSVLDPAVRELRAAHMRRLKACGDKDNDGTSGDARHRVTPILDPSGVVYEAFPENTLAGVTATLYEVSGDGTVGEPWNAEEYEQVNPQITDSNGVFAWDVPSGTWQVQFTKDGYETTTTDSLEVPPPQTGLAVAMVSTAKPKVTGVTADTDHIEIAFDQWMDAGATCPVSVNGAPIDADQLEWAQVVYSGDAEGDGATRQGFSKVLHVPVPEGTKVGDKLDIQLSDTRNYAGKTLVQQTFEDVVVAQCPSEIVLNFDETVCLKAGTSRGTTVRVLDASGEPVAGATVMATLDSSYLAAFEGEDGRTTKYSAVTDEQGKVRIPIVALLPGMSDLTLSVVNSPLSRTVALLTTANELQAARPTATLGDVEIGAGAASTTSVTVEPGTQLELACTTEGATIYYTTDGSCPCQRTDGRTTYEEPITLTEGATYIVAAYKDGMDYSERLTIEVKVSSPSLENATITLDTDTYTYDGKAKEPVPTVVLGDKTLVSGTDYTVAYADNTNAGTAKITVTGSGKYAGTQDVTFTIKKAAQTITAANKSVAMGKTVALGAKASGGGKLTYASASTAIAKVSASGTVTPVKVGKVKVTIKAAATANYNAASKTVVVTVVQGAQAITVANNECVTGKTASLGAKTSGNGKLTYKSANTAVATVSATGVVTGKKAGTVKVTITAAKTANFKAATKVVTVKVGKANTIAAKAKASVVEVSFAKAKSAAQVTANNVTVTKPVGAVTYANASTNATAKKFKVAASTGKVTVPKGTAKGKYLVVLNVKAAGNSATVSGTKAVKYYVLVGAANTMGAKAKAATVAVAYSKVRSAAQVTAPNVSVTKPVGTVTYANASTDATAKEFKVAVSTGKVTVPKGTAKGKYQVVLKVKAAGNTTTLSTTKVVKYYIQVK